MSLTNDEKYFVGIYTGDVQISEDENAPSYLPINNILKSNEFELVDSATGAVRLTCNRRMKFIMGSISIHPDQGSAGQTAKVILYSEKSFDGINWTINKYSRRDIEINRDNESFQTNVSWTVDWLPDEIIRFRIYLDTGSSVNLVTVNSTRPDGQELVTPAIVWMLGEQ